MPAILLFHLTFMILAFVFMASGMIVARFFKKSKSWLLTHRILGVSGSLSAVGGIVSAGIMVQASGGPHLRVPHGIFGFVVILLCLSMPVIGSVMLKAKGNSAKLRKFHRILGRTILGLMVVVILFGFITAGIIVLG